ncbi:hypothetical protein [Croceicoccus sp. Ery5]|uniref:hypothetical protein n=1 Tax=Croceicoccus sp. Ery5 TaxID=1703340 RepID=UPI001E28D1A6|nr:hypothetical protein [Croceicoccus sp. Ery5]
MVEKFPVTWGYLLIGLSGAMAAIAIIRKRDLQLAPIVQTGALFLPLAAMVYFKAQQYNLPSSRWIPFTVIFGLLPILILVAITPQLERIRTADMARAIRPMIRFAVVWGLMNFVLFIFTRDIIEIPYLTVNIEDAGTILSKNNLRSGWLMKLVSTYNNGNIFGVCMIMMMPVYLYFEDKKIWRALFIVAIICTLSRTSWFAMVAVFILMAFSGQIRLNRTGVWVAVGAAFCVFLVILPLLGWTSANLIDDRLGGRMTYLRELNITLFGAEEIYIPEVVYYGLLQSFGLFGLILALAAMGYGIGFGLMHWGQLNGLRRAAVVGALGYCAAAAMDGAMMYPPVFPIFLFLNALIYRRGYFPAAGVGQTYPAPPRPRQARGDGLPHPAIPQ